MEDNYPIQNGDFDILNNALRECIWITTLMCMPWNKKLYWRIRGMNAYYKSR